jgi:hypothetical protein
VAIIKKSKKIAIIKTMDKSFVPLGLNTAVLILTSSFVFFFSLYTSMYSGNLFRHGFGGDEGRKGFDTWNGYRITKERDKRQ